MRGADPDGVEPWRGVGGQGGVERRRRGAKRGQLLQIEAPPGYMPSLTTLIMFLPSSVLGQRRRFAKCVRVSVRVCVCVCDFGFEVWKFLDGFVRCCMCEVGGSLVFGKKWDLNRLCGGILLDSMFLFLYWLCLFVRLVLVCVVI